MNQSLRNLMLMNGIKLSGPGSQPRDAHTKRWVPATGASATASGGASHSSPRDAILNGAGKDKSVDMLFTAHAGTYNPAKGTGSAAQYHSGGSSHVIIAHPDGSHVKHISSAGEHFKNPDAVIGARGRQVKQGHNKDTKQDVRVVGYVSSSGSRHGYVPNKHLQSFVFK